MVLDRNPLGLVLGGTLGEEEDSLMDTVEVLQRKLRSRVEGAEDRVTDNAEATRKHCMRERKTAKLSSQKYWYGNICLADSWSLFRVMEAPKVRRGAVEGLAAEDRHRDEGEVATDQVEASYFLL